MTATAFGLLSTATAVYRDNSVHLGSRRINRRPVGAEQGNKVKATDSVRRNLASRRNLDYGNIPQNVDQEKLTAVIEEAFQEPGTDTMRNTQAIVVVYRDRVIAEKYEAQFPHQTPMLGLSMTKSITNALIGILVGKGELDIMQPAPVDAWQVPGDNRAAITLDQLLRMSSGLELKRSTRPLKMPPRCFTNQKAWPTLPPQNLCEQNRIKNGIIPVEQPTF